MRSRMRPLRANGADLPRRLRRRRDARHLAKGSKVMIRRGRKRPERLRFFVECAIKMGGTPLRVPEWDHLESAVIPAAGFRIHREQRDVLFGSKLRADER